MIQRVQKGEFPPPSKVKPSVSKPLEAICLKAMALRPADRYASPRALAEDIEHWLADEALIAYRPPVWERARRWFRQRPKVRAWFIALGALNLFGLFLLSGSGRVPLLSSIVDNVGLLLFFRFLAWITCMAIFAQGYVLLCLIAGGLLGFGRQLIGSTSHRGIPWGLGIGQQIGMIVGPLFGYATALYVSTSFGQFWSFFGPSGPTALAVTSAVLCPVSGFLVGLFARQYRPDALKRIASSTIVGTIVGLTAGIGLRTIDEYTNRADQDNLTPPKRIALSTVFDPVDATTRRHNIIRGKEQPATDVERLQLAFQCFTQRSYASAVRLYAPLMTNMRSMEGSDRSIALHAAILAGFGRGDDAAEVNPEQRTAIRKQGLMWLREELSELKRQLAKEEPLEPIRDQPTLRKFMQQVFLPDFYSDGELGSVWSERAIAGIPREEQEDWRKIQQEVASIGTPGYQARAAEGLRMLSRVLSDRGEFGNARRVLDESVLLYQAALAGSPSSATYKVGYGKTLAALGEAQLRMEAYSEAADTVNRILSVGGDSARESYSAAMLMARCIPLAEQDTRNSPAKRNELASQFADRAMAALSRALAKGYKDLDNMRTDPGFRALWSREDFKKALGELEARNKAPKPVGTDPTDAPKKR